MHKTLLFLSNLKEKNLPKDGRQMVDVDLILPKPLHTYYNNNFALQTYNHSHSALILNTHTSPIQQYTLDA
jgi:hypothetical protein